VKPDVGAAHDYRDIAIAKLAGDVVSAKGVNRPGCDGDEIGLGIEAEVLDLLVDESDIPIRRSERREIRKCERYESAGTGFEDSAISLGSVM
jgi:hypothetical protein